jgi:hypothetical protein
MDQYVSQLFGIADPMRVYAIVGAVLLLILSGWIAVRELARVRILAPADYARRYPGRQPWSKEGLDKRIAALESYKQSKMLHYLWHFGLLTFFGLVVPSLLLGAAVTHYDWLSGGDVAFVTSGQPASTVAHPTAGQASMFVLSQFIRSPTDVLEIFNIEISPIQVAHGQTLVNLGILAYHLFIGAFALVIFYTAYVMFRVSSGIDPKLQQLFEFRKKLYPFSG